MKKFSVEYTVSGTAYFIVSASTKEEAESKAMKLLWDEADDFELEIHDVNTGECV